MPNRHAPAAAMRGRIALPMLLILIAALALGAGLWAGQRFFAPAADEPPALQAALAYPQPRELPPFTLRQSDGTGLTREDLAGQWTLVFFGFTHCPDVCPTTLAQLAKAGKRWTDLPTAQRPRVLFVSVDPERDSAERSGEYARYFDADALAATGDHAELEPFARSLGMVYMRTPVQRTPEASVAAGTNGTDGNGTDSANEQAGADAYTVDHSSSVAVLDPDVRLVALLRPPLDPALVAADLRTLVAARQSRTPQ